MGMRELSPYQCGCKWIVSESVDRLLVPEWLPGDCRHILVQLRHCRCGAAGIVPGSVHGFAGWGGVLLRGLVFRATDGLRAILFGGAKRVAGGLESGAGAGELGVKFSLDVQEHRAFAEGLLEIPFHTTGAIA